MKNKKEFDALTDRYESITLEEIEKAWPLNALCPGHETANKLTGFGREETCTLCIAAYENCTYCVYKIKNGCHTDTYYAVLYAQTPQELHTAFGNRAKWMREFKLKKQKLEIMKKPENQHRDARIASKLNYTVELIHAIDSSMAYKLKLRNYDKLRWPGDFEITEKELVEQFLLVYTAENITLVTSIGGELKIEINNL